MARIRNLLLSIAQATVLLSSSGIIALAQDQGGKQVRVGWTSYPADLPPIADAIEGGKTAAAALNVHIEFALAAGAVAQASAVDNLLASGVDVLAIDPEDSKAIGPSIRKANELGVPVIMWIGDNLDAGDTVSLVASDEEKGGYDIARWALNSIGGAGKIGLIQGAKAHQAGQLRENGFRRALKEFPNVELVAYGEAQWMRDRANTLASDMITRDPGLKLLVALGDDMAAGVYTATQAAGVNIPVTGYNGSCEGLNNVWKGRLKATLYQGFRGIGTKVVQTAVDVAAGKSVPRNISMPAYVIDYAFMEEAVKGSSNTASESVVMDIKRAVNGCK